MNECERWMHRAIELARDGINQGAGGPFGAVVVRNGLIIGEGWNRVIELNDPTSHGEIMAIRDACTKLGSYSLVGCEIYTTGQPCPMCLGAIHWARLERIYYGFNIRDAAELGFDDTEFFRQLGLSDEERLIRAEECCRDEALALGREYSALTHRIAY